MRSAFREVDTLFLLFPMVESMVDFAKGAVEAAQETGIKHIVRSSGYGAAEDSDFLMSRIQGTIDSIIKSSGIDYTITKPNEFYAKLCQFVCP